MRTLRMVSVVVAGVIGILICAPAHAVSNRIFMSTNGNNANDCANPLTPCLTFVGALAQVNPGGEVIAEATGGYGPLNITQAVTISGPPGVVIYSGLQVVVNAPGAKVVVRGLTVDGTGATGNGILVQAVGSLFVESCVLTGFTGTGVTGSGIYMTANGNLFVKDSIIRGNGNEGIWITPSSGTVLASIENCRIEGNSFYGLISDSGAITTVSNSVASGNGSAGFLAEISGELNIQNCVAANNGTGIESDFSGSLVRVSASTVTDNVTGLVHNSSGALVSRGNNTVEGNETEGTFTGSFSAK